MKEDAENLKKPPEKFSDSKKPNIVEIVPNVSGIVLSLQCDQCEHLFKSYQPTIAGVVIGSHYCPKCKSEIGISPKEFDQCLSEHLPEGSFEELKSLIEEASETAKSWYLSETIQILLTYRGINLGKPSERGLMSVFSNWEETPTGGRSGH